MEDKGPSRSVVPISLINGGKREPQLTAAELVAVRKMLEEHALIVRACPLAQKIVSGG